MLVIQHINIQWTKASRGGNLAEKRNLIAKSFPVPTAPPTYDRQDHFVIHHVRFGESNEFIAPIDTEITSPKTGTPFTTKNVTVEQKVDTAIVTYEWRDGAPERKFFDKSGTPVPVRKRFVASLNNWVMVEYNGRFTGYDCGRWWYEHSIINVAVTDTEYANLFVESNPNIFSQQLEHLW
ncbi:hypothetical protein OAG71_00655 [bacterium]|nr:hypothetical protein [bacterium]